MTRDEQDDLLKQVDRIESTSPDGLEIDIRWD
jgi:hypothetical protein